MELKDELIGRAHELKPVIAARAAATEKNGALLDETVKDLCEAGFMQILVPKRYGGHELHVDTLVEVTRIISSACVSTGWVTTFYIGHNVFHAAFPERSQDEVWAERPYALTSGQLAPTARAKRVAGGYEVSGQQSWSSGVVHADWVLFCGLVIEEGKEPEVRYFTFPRDKVELIDNWDIAGMCGTGSHDVRVTEEFVPEYHTVLLADFLNGKAPGTALHSNPMYKMPGTMIKYLETLAVLNGALRGAAEGFLEMTKDRIAAYTGASVATKPAAQMRLGRAFATLDAVDDLVDSAAARIVRYDGSRPLAVAERAAMRSRVGQVVKMSADGVSDILQGAGGNSFRESSSLQRFFRDVNVLRTHAVLDNETATELRGRIELGLDPATMVI